MKKYAWDLPEGSSRAAIESHSIAKHVVNVRKTEAEMYRRHYMDCFKHNLHKSWWKRDDWDIRHRYTGVGYYRKTMSGSAASMYYGNYFAMQQMVKDWGWWHLFRVLLWACVYNTSLGRWFEYNERMQRVED